MSAGGVATSVPLEQKHLLGRQPCSCGKVKGPPLMIAVWSLIRTCFYLICGRYSSNNGFYLSLAVALLGRLAGAQTVNLMHVVVRNGVSGLYMTVLSTLTLKTLLPTYELSHSKHFPALALTRLRQAE